MAISEQQRELRRKFIGSSDSAAILGVDPYRTAADLYLEKTGQADDFAGNADTERGQLLEPVILNWAERELGETIERDVNIPPCAMFPHLTANLDGQIVRADRRYEVVEAKSSVNPDEWGDEGSDQVPDRVLVQVHHAMLLSGVSCRVAWVPVLLPGYRSFDFRMYRVERDDVVCEAIAKRTAEFMREHVQVRVPPTDFRPSLEILKRIRREPNARKELDPLTFDRWVAARAFRLKAEEVEEAAQRDLFAELGVAEAGTIEGADVVTYFEQTARYKPQPAREVKSRVLRLTKTGKQMEQLNHQTQVPALEGAK